MSPALLQNGMDTAHAWALVRTPGKPWRLAHELGQGASFVIHPFDGNNPTLQLHEADNVPVPFNTPLQEFREPLSNTKHQHTGLIEGVQRAFAGRLEKVVISRIKSHTLDTPLHPQRILEQLDEKYPAACVFALHVPGEALWIGASPERLLTLHQGRGETMALAGTRVSANLASDPWTAKEIHEQALVADYIASNLTNPSTQVTRQIGPFDQTAGHLSHRCTTFEFTTRDSAEAVANRLHPTPAVCGTPQREALDWIQRNELHDRKLYAGYFGWNDNQHCAELFVTLRCMQLTPSKAWLYVGGGITQASEPIAEWEETEAKAETLLSVLRMC